MKQLIIHAFANWKVKQENLQSVLSLLPELAEKTRTEEGNLQYNIYQSPADPTQLILAETYRDEASLEAHRSSVHFQQIVLQQIVPLLEKREVILTKELNY